MFKERDEKSTFIIAQTHYTVIFSLSLNRNREVSRRLRTGKCCDFLLIALLFPLLRFLFNGHFSIWVLIWWFIIGPPLRYLFRKKTSEPRRLPALFTVTLLKRGIHSISANHLILTYFHHYFLLFITKRTKFHFYLIFPLNWIKKYFWLLFPLLRYLLTGHYSI